MKKIKLLTGLSTLSVLGLSTLPLTSCNKVHQYTVHFETNGGTEIADIIVEKDSTISEPITPYKWGLEFIGWYSDEACTKAFDFNTKITSNLTLYAKWEQLDEMTLDEIVNQYSIWIEDFYESSLTYKKEDLRIYIDGKEEEIDEVGYTTKQSKRIFRVHLASASGGHYIQLAGQTVNQFKELISGFKESKFYKSSNYIYTWGYDENEVEQLMVFNKFGYSVAGIEVDSEEEEEPTTQSLYVSYLNDPTE